MCIHIIYPILMNMIFFNQAVQHGIRDDHKYTLPDEKSIKLMVLQRFVKTKKKGKMCTREKFFRERQILSNWSQSCACCRGAHAAHLRFSHPSIISLKMAKIIKTYYFVSLLKFQTGTSFACFKRFRQNLL